jgi:ABC-type sugar transport system substrate-binding protein
MKKLLFFLLAAAIVIGSAGCAASTPDTATPAPSASYEKISTAPTIALIFAQENSFYERMQKEAEAIAAEKGYEIKTYYSNSDSQQVSDIYSALGAGALSIMLVPRNMDNMQDVLDECVLQDVPVINLMVPVNGRVNMLVCPDYQLMGARGAQAIRNALGEDPANVFLLESVEGTFVSQLTHDGFAAECAGLEGVTIKAVGLVHLNPDEAYAETKKQLANDPDINAVFAMDESFVKGVLEAARESGRDIKIVSVGGNSGVMEMVSEGSVYASVFISPAELAQIAMEHAVKSAADPNYILPQYQGLTVETIFPTDVDKYRAFGDYADTLTNKAALPQEPLGSQPEPSGSPDGQAGGESPEPS